MTHGPSKTLLPDGLRDVLPPEATREATVMRGLIDRFRSSAYRRVDPPLVEFEDSLLDGAGTATAPHTFRLMDPVSQRMMGVRADMTIQVARIATSRLIKAPRPLRLCYAGPVLRVRGSQLRPERQVSQAGCEIYGSDQAEADAEIIAVAADALHSVGAKDLSVDLSLPTIVPAVCEDLGLDAKTRKAARLALDRKDAHDVAALGGEAAKRLGALLDASGLARPALEKLQSIPLPPAAEAERTRLTRVMDLLEEAVPDLSLTVDPVEHRGFEYQTGLSFTLFAKGVRGELGRGGRYSAGSEDTHMEPATGFSLYLDSVLRAVPAAARQITVYLSATTSPAQAAALRQAGWCTLSGLAPVDDIQAEARRLDCTHFYDPMQGDTPCSLD
jgi:ATP phosphoribosyltransferase regulatory subunit